MNLKWPISIFSIIGCAGGACENLVFSEEVENILLENYRIKMKYFSMCDDMYMRKIENFDQKFVFSQTEWNCFYINKSFEHDNFPSKRSKFLDDNRDCLGH